MISPHGLVDESITIESFQDRISKEFEFFDTHFFETHLEARINIYYSGHGKLGKIHLADFDFEYWDIVKHIIDCANN